MYMTVYLKQQDLASGFRNDLFDGISSFYIPFTMRFSSALIFPDSGHISSLRGIRYTDVALCNKITVFKFKYATAVSSQYLKCFGICIN